MNENLLKIYKPLSPLVEEEKNTRETYLHLFNVVSISDLQMERRKH